MGQYTFNLGGIDGLCMIIPTVYSDDRGFFMETYNAKEMREAGLNISFVQDNQSFSSKGVLRGLHFQKNYPQAKLVRAIHGAVFDVAVDLRKNSQTFGRYYGAILSEENKKQLFIPHGFAHGFLVLSDIAEICYKCDDFYHPDDEGGLAWNDPEIGIKWPCLNGIYNGNASAEGYDVNGAPIIMSEKDQKWKGLYEVFSLRGVLE